MRWYNDLYVGHRAMDNRQKIIDNINNGKPQFNKYVLALPFNDSDVLDIYPSYILLQKRYRNSELMIIGIADGIEETYDLIQLAIMDCYNDTGGFNMRDYICRKE